MAELASVTPIRPEALSSLPTIQARIDRYERYRTGGNQFGDLGGTMLQSILDDAARGNVARWADLCEFALTTDPHLLSLYTTRLVRVAQADYIVVPNKFGHPGLAALAAEFVNEQLGRINGLQNALCELLHAIAVGFSASEMLWQYDSQRKCYYVDRIEWRHGHRFRYDLAWQLRLYDQGQRRGPKGAEGYGEQLDPMTWIVHHHQEVATYPGSSGVMRACVYPWMFCRWVEKFEISYLEKYGAPFIWAEVPKNTPEQARRDMLSRLTDMTAEHAAVVEEGDQIHIEAAGAQAKSGDGFDKYLESNRANITKAWLGASDLVDPGKSGSQAAVTTRAGVTMDPRMVSDGQRLCETLKQTLFKRLIYSNAHLFPAAIGTVPIPDMRFKTADDEVKRDVSDKAGEIVDQNAANQAAEDHGDGNQPYEVHGDPGADPKPEPTNAQGQPPHQMSLSVPPGAGAIEMMIRHEGGKWYVYTENGDKRLGGPYDSKEQAVARLREIEHFKSKSSAVPKAPAPASRPGRTKTSQTSSRLRSPIASALRGELVASVSSSPSRSRTPSKR